MSNEADDQLEGQAVARPAAGPRRTGYDWKEIRQRFKDLIVVFFGVYAAFVLNRFDADRRDATRRDQILGVLEREVSANVDDLQQSLDGVQPGVEEFVRKLAAGEMPHLNISYSNSSYSPSDDATLLQAGGVEVLDVQTLDGLRKVNGLRRTLVASVQNQFQLQLMILGPHEEGSFYDLDTKQLKTHYSWYPVVLHQVIKDARTLLASEKEFLGQLRARRHAR